MALFKRFFYRKPPDGLLEISERVFVFDCCFTTDVLEDIEYKSYMTKIVESLREYSPDASFMVFNFREGENQSHLSQILSEYDMTVMDYPQCYENTPLLQMETIHHFLRSSESWLSLGQHTMLLMHCEHGGWPVLAFMLAALLIYRKQYTGEQKTLDMTYKQAPRELLKLICPLNPIPSQLRYLQYVSRRNLGSEWPPHDRALTLDCVILRLIPNMDREGGCRPIFRIYGQDPLMDDDRTAKMLYSTPKRSRSVRYYKQADCELVKIDIRCHVQGDIVLECISLGNDLECEIMVFRVMFNTAFIRSNILMVNRDEIDFLWGAKNQFPINFRTEVLFSEMDVTAALLPIDLPDIEVKGLPVEAFAKVQEIFSNVEWLGPKADKALNKLQEINNQNEKLDLNSPLVTENINLLRELCSEEIKKKPAAEGIQKIDNLLKKLDQIPSQKANEEPVWVKSEENVINSQLETNKFDIQSPCIDVNTPAYTNIITRQKSRRCLSAPVLYCNSSQGSPVNLSRYHSSPSLLGILALLQGENELDNKETNHYVRISSSNITSPKSPTHSSPTKHVSSPESGSLSSSPPLRVPLGASIASSKPLELLEPTSSPGFVSATSLVSPQPPTPSEPTLIPDNGFSAQPPPPGLVQLLSEPTSSTDTELLPTSQPPSPGTISSSRTTPRSPPPPPPLSRPATSPIIVPPPPAGTRSSTSIASVGPPPPPLRPTQIPSVTPLTPPPVPSPLMPNPPPPPPPSLAPKTTLPKNSPHIPPVPPPPAPKINGKTPGINGKVPPVPGPPSIKKGRLPLRVNSRALDQPKTPLKPYHWLKLTRAMNGSLWADAQKSDEASKAPEIDIFELESLFAVAVPSSNNGGKSSSRVSGPKSEKVNLIDLRRAYNCEIMLTKVKVPLPELMSSILTLDDSALDIDQVENLVKFCPTKEEIEILKNYKDDKEKLGKCEQFFLEMMKVPRVESKLRVFAFKLHFSTQLADLKKNLNTVNSVANEIRNSVKLKRIMQTILSLGNALNHGTARGSAVGFRLDSLLKLTDTRARNNKMTLMHYLCKVLAEKLPELLDFPNDLISLESSTKIQLKYLAEEMQAISKGLEKVIQELSVSENDGFVSESFCKILIEFLGFAEGEVRSLASLYSGVGRNADALALYFGEDPARTPFEQVVSTLLNFVRMFVRAREENKKQSELDKKKAQKEEAEYEKAKVTVVKKEAESAKINSRKGIQNPENGDQ